LIELNLNDCKHLKSIPDQIGKMEKLRKLNLGMNANI